jgi:hypothetical protein
MLPSLFERARLPVRPVKTNLTEHYLHSEKNFLPPMSQFSIFRYIYNEAIDIQNNILI